MTEVTLIGRLICTSPAQAEIVAAHLPEHIRLTRAEPGCLSFEVAPTADPMVWTVAERFATRADFDAHQIRTKASRWAAETTGIARDYEITEG